MTGIIYITEPLPFVVGPDLRFMRPRIFESAIVAVVVLTHIHMWLYICIRILL